MSAIPLNTKEVITLEQLGINPRLANAQHAAMSNDKNICLVESSGDVVILYLQTMSVSHHQLKADAAAMHPSRHVIALWSARLNMLQLLNLDARERLKTFKLPNGAALNYSRWIDDETLVFVAGGSVFHWSLQPPESSPTEVFRLEGPLASGSITDYLVSHDGQWLAVSNQSSGKVQLFSREKNVSNVIDACTVSFAAAGLVPLLISASETRMEVQALGDSPDAHAFGRKSVDLPIEADDVPRQLVVSPKYSSAFLFTKLGYLHVVEYETPFVYISERVSQVSLVHAGLCGNGNVVALSSSGGILVFSIKDTIVNFVAASNPQAAAKIAAGRQTQV